MNRKKDRQKETRQLLTEIELLKYGKPLIFVLLVTVEIILFVNNMNSTVTGVKVMWVLVLLEALLLIENAVKLWALKTFRQRIICYVLDSLLLLLLTYFTDGELISTLYVVILSEFYLNQERLSGSIAMGVCSIVLYLAMFILSGILRDESVNVINIVSNAFNDFVILIMHFLIMNFALQIYRKNRKIADMLEELRQSNEKLQLANEELKTVTLLEERQRIAKDIHDTAGHSITTVIMQTEAAKLAIDENPAEAKRKIISANLQAKNALEELRGSVHVLSGMGANESLKEELKRIIHESTDGTDIVIRSEIDDITLGAEKSRFICNTLKEGISNGLRHGGATAFWFELRRERSDVVFLLSDNGKGADINALSEGLGLSGMRKRAERLGGTVRFDSEENEGFEINMTLPADGGGREQ